MLKYLKYLRFPIHPKVKELQYQIMNSYNQTAETLKKRFGFEVDPAFFCLEAPETVEYLFYSCRAIVFFFGRT